MPVKGFYLDDETYHLLEEESTKQGRKAGEILHDVVRIELQKRASEETRPKVCRKCSGILEWHLTAQDMAELYGLCLTCGEKHPTREIFRTRLL